jgi:hypothetical protein
VAQLEEGGTLKTGSLDYNFSKVKGWGHIDIVKKKKKREDKPSSFVSWCSTINKIYFPWGCY